MGEPHLLGRKRLAALDRIDAMTPELRAVAHEIGLPLVAMFLDAGVSDPGRIRHLVTACWMNSQGDGNSRPGLASQIDALLIRQGGVVTSGMLALLLRHMGSGMLPASPSPQMVKASIAETGKHGLMSKEDKHRLRLAAGIRAGLAQHWPDVWNA